MDECENSYRRQAKTVAQVLAVAVIASVILVCVRETGMQSKLEMGTITCSVMGAAAVLAFFSYVTVTTDTTPCLQENLQCEDTDMIKTPAAQAINWMASFIALAVVLNMYRNRAGVWHLIGAYILISLLGLSAAMGFSAYVDHTVGSKLAHRCPSSA